MQAIPSTIRHVTVYAQGALIERAATVPKGQQEIALEGLPLTVVDSTLRGHVSGSSSVLSASIALRFADTDKPTEEGLDEKVLEQSRIVAELNAQLQIVEEQCQSLGNIEVPDRDDSGTEVTVPPMLSGARRALVDFIDEEIEKLVNKRIALAKKISEQSKELRHLKERLAYSSRDITLKADQTSKCAVLQLDKPTSDDCEVTIHYRVVGARWSPCYRVDVSKSGESLGLVMQAAVAQKTGEDWKGAVVSLSTAHVQNWFDLPKLNALKLGRAQPQPPLKGLRPAPDFSDELFYDYDEIKRQFETTPAWGSGSSRPMGQGAYEDAIALVDEALEDSFMSGAMEEAEIEQPSPSMAPPPNIEAPPMPPSAPPMPSAAAPRRSAKAKARRAVGASADVSFGGGLGGGGPGASAPKKKRAKPVAAEPSFLLNYDELFMPAPTESGRGRLKPSNDQHIYGARAPLAKSFVAEALVGAQSVVSLALPQGHAGSQQLGDFAEKYDGERPCDIPSDGRFHTIAMGVGEGPSAIHYVAVPQQQSDVFRVIRGQNPFAESLLKGPADIYLDGRYAMTVQMPKVPAKGELTLGLGVEPELRVAHNSAFGETTTGLMGGTRALRHEIAVRVQNRLPTNAEVEIRQSLPTPRPDQDDIEVNVIEVKPQWARIEGEPAGVHQWEINLEASSESTLNLVYEIQIPSKFDLRGGNRRA